jgi:hypothetical protein
MDTRFQSHAIVLSFGVSVNAEKEVCRRFLVLHKKWKKEREKALF